MNLRWLKRLFFARSSASAKTIIYSLPDPSKFSKYYNKDEHFKDVVWTDWPAVINGFKKRFDGWYFANMNGGHSSYLDLCSLCALVEVFAHYKNSKDWHDQAQYKDFLRRLDPIFRKRLTNPIIFTRMIGGKWVEAKLKDYADVFYSGVRCALHHHGDLATYAGMSGTGTIARDIADAGTSICGGYSYSIIVFDPGKLKESLGKYLQQYCDELKANPASDQARLFKKKFQNDFGINIPGRF